jgi:hypothetical protein
VDVGSLDHHLLLRGRSHWNEQRRDSGSADEMAE